MKRVVAVFLAGVAVFAEAASYVSPECLAVTPDGQRAYVTSATGGRLLVMDLGRAKVVGEWLLKNETERPRGFWSSLFGGGATAGSADPSGVAVAPDGTVFVTGGGAEGFVQKFAADGTPAVQAAAGHTPLAPVEIGRAHV